MNQYLGRQGVVRNLRTQLMQGTSAVVAGGPRMGKTIFLQQTTAALAPEAATVSIDLLEDKPVDPARKIPEGLDPVILLLDGCEAVLPDPAPFLNQIVRASGQSGKNLRGIVWAGGIHFKLRI